MFEQKKCFFFEQFDENQGWCTTAAQKYVFVLVKNKIIHSVRFPRLVVFVYTCWVTIQFAHSLNLQCETITRFANGQFREHFLFQQNKIFSCQAIHYTFLFLFLFFKQILLFSEKVLSLKNNKDFLFSGKNYESKKFKSFFSLTS